MKVNDTVKVVKGSKADLIGKITDIGNTTVEVYFESLKDTIYSDAKLSFLIQTSLIRKIRNLENLVSLHIVLDSKERIAKYLYEHTEDFFNTKNIIIAEILNLSPETLSRMLRVFKNDGLINNKNKTVDKEKLRMLFS